jgi:hypothetical protein
MVPAAAWRAWFSIDWSCKTFAKLTGFTDVATPTGVSSIVPDP